MNICLLVLGRGAAKVNRKKRNPLFSSSLIFFSRAREKKKFLSLSACVREKREELRRTLEIRRARRVRVSACACVRALYLIGPLSGPLGVDKKNNNNDDETLNNSFFCL